jgi:nucleotide-binding universal stress UspA family protein
MYQHVLIATDGSELATKAVKQGVGLAKACKAKVTIVVVTEPFNSLGDKQHMFSGLPDDLRRQAVNFLFEAANRALKQAGNVAEAASVRCSLKSIENTHPFEAIIATAEQDGCDLLVMASHGRSGVSKLLLGSETMKVLTHPQIPVLVCR